MPQYVIDWASQIGANIDPLFKASPVVQSMSEMELANSDDM